MNQDRENAVRALVECSDSLIVIKDRLRKFSWDYEGNRIELSLAHVIGVLNKYIDGSLTASEVEDWAELIESRDDISFVKDSENWIAEMIYELANPYLTEPLTRERARAIIKNQ